MPSTTDHDQPRTALVLDAGGARSAYQVGVLEVLLPVLAERGEQPRVLIGTSAGALLTAVLASTAHLDAHEQVERLQEMLQQATKGNVIRPLWRQAPEVVARYVSETLGLDGFRLRGLFGTQPLARTLERLIDWQSLHRNTAEGRVIASVTTTCVGTGRVVMFTETSEPLPTSPPQFHGRFVEARLGVPHFMASAAIPTLFPSIRIDEPASDRGWYVDGATRRREPFNPAVELGAHQVVAIGTGSLRPPEEPAYDVPVDLGDGAATLLGAVMDDPMRHDLCRLGEINRLTEDPDIAPALERLRLQQGKEPLRTVPYVAVAPAGGSELAETAMEVFAANHGSLLRTLGDPDMQIMHRLLGSDSPLQGELLSYLMFDTDFFEAATALGRRDGEAWLEEHPDLWRTAPLEE